MKRILLAGLIGCCVLSTPTWAQTPDTKPVVKASLPVHMSKFRARRIRHTCETQAKAKNLPSAEHQTFATQCFEREAQAREERKICRAQGRAKGITSVNELREFVKTCMLPKKD